MVHLQKSILERHVQEMFVLSTDHRSKTDELESIIEDLRHAVVRENARAKEVENISREQLALASDEVTSEYANRVRSESESMLLSQRLESVEDMRLESEARVKDVKQQQLEAEQEIERLRNESNELTSSIEIMKGRHEEEVSNVGGGEEWRDVICCCCCPFFYALSCTSLFFFFFFISFSPNFLLLFLFIQLNQSLSKYQHMLENEKQTRDDMTSSHLNELERLRIELASEMESSNLESSSSLIHDRLEMMRERDDLLARMSAHDVEVATARGDAKELREKNLSLQDMSEEKEQEMSDINNSLVMVRKELSLLRESKFSSDVDAVLEIERRMAVMEVKHQNAMRDMQKEAEEQAHKSFEYNQNERASMLKEMETIRNAHAEEINRRRKEEEEHYKREEKLAEESQTQQEAAVAAALTDAHSSLRLVNKGFPRDVAMTNHNNTTAFAFASAAAPAPAAAAPSPPPPPTTSSSPYSLLTPQHTSSNSRAMQFQDMAATTTNNNDYFEQRTSSLEEERDKLMNTVEREGREQQRLNRSLKWHMESLEKIQAENLELKQERKVLEESLSEHESKKKRESNQYTRERNGGNGKQQKNRSETDVLKETIDFIKNKQANDIEEVVVRCESRHATEKQRMQDQLSLARESIVVEEKRTEQLEISLSTFKAKAYELGKELRDTESSLREQLERERERHATFIEEQSRSSEERHGEQLAVIVATHETLVQRMNSEHRLLVSSLEARLEESVELGRKQSSQLDNLTGAMRVEREHRKKVEGELKEIESELEEERQRKGPTISLELHRKHMTTMEERYEKKTFFPFPFPFFFYYFFYYFFLFLFYFYLF